VGPPPAEWLTDPAWSPDGRIAYITGPRTADGRADYARAEIWVSNGDGSDRRRLFPAYHDQVRLRDLRWSADGSRLTYVMESSGGVAAHWISSDGTRFGSLAEMHKDPLTACCMSSPDGVSAVYTKFGADGAMEVRLSGDVENDRLLADGISSQSRPRITSASWSPDSKRVTYVSDGECPTELAVYTVRADGKDVRRLTRPCRIVGTHGPNRLRGTPRVDALYGRGGNDRLEASGRPDFLQGGLGRDVLLGGPGDDRLYGGPGSDRFYAGPGWDALYTRDGAADVVHCGAGKDAVRADPRDRIARDCELVERE
jgi:Ca2+-binding RTX toxin-like protein